MIGQIQIITYLLAVYLVYKGYEIFQIAFMSESKQKKIGMIIGGFAFIGSILVALLIVYLMEEQANRVGTNVNLRGN